MEIQDYNLKIVRNALITLLRQRQIKEEIIREEFTQPDTGFSESEMLSMIQHNDQDSPQIKVMLYEIDNELKKNNELQSVKQENKELNKISYI